MSVNNKGSVDLHVHTTCSDGLLRPEEVVLKAKELDLAAIGIADHDSVSGIEKAQQIGSEIGLEIVPAAELSCIHNSSDIHILGYYLDYHNLELMDFLSSVQKQRLERAHKIVGKLSEQGVNIDVDRVLELSAGASVGRPHIAQVLLERGYVNSFNEAFWKFIGYHCPAYVPKMEISPPEAINLIKKFAGIPILAHPGSYRSDELVYSLIQAGISGLEVWHPEHSQSAADHYLEICQKNGLLVTGGSDCHGGRKGKIFMGEVRIPYHYLAELKERKS
jgi:3',5'-nucleoside bisphosphate phosphatase